MAAIPHDLMTATQPSATSTLQAPTYNPDGLKRLGAKLSSRFAQYESDRRLAEMKWGRNARQFLGVYDPEVEKAIDPNRSRAYPKLTRTKCVSMLSRLMNLLFQADDKNWTVAPSPVPDLSSEDLQQVLDTLELARMKEQDQGQGQGQDAPNGAMPAGPLELPEIGNAEIEQAILDFARRRALRLEREIDDQLQELGGTRMQNYVALCRRVLASGIQYGAGVVKGPFLEEQTQRRWSRDAAGRMQAIPQTVYRPRFEFVPLWDYYPDMSAKTLDQMEGQFQRIVMSRPQLNRLRDRPDFIEDQIARALQLYPQGNYRRRPHETEMRAQGVQVNAPDAGRNKYEAVIWDGFLTGQDLADCGLAVPDGDLQADILAQVWIVDSVVIKAQLDPWRDLQLSDPMRQYHHFIFEEDETFLLGNGLPSIMRDSQMGLCAAVRMALDNGSVQRVFEMNLALLSPSQDLTAINHDKIFFRDDDSPATAQYPAIRTIEIPLHLPEYQALGRMFQEFADQETFVSAATGGDMQRGPSEPFRTAAGASMLRGDAALPFKDVVRNFDMFTESVIGALINFNRNFNPNPDLRGDFQPVARGATSLIAKEVLGMQLDHLAQTLSEEEKPYVNMRELARARIRVRDLGASGIVYDDARCDAIDAQRAAAGQTQATLQQQMVEAQTREILSQVEKNLAQAQKNATGARVAETKQLLDATQQELTADQTERQQAMDLQDQLAAQALAQAQTQAPTAMPTRAEA